MYGKSFESKYSGSLVGAGINVFAVWDYITTMARRGTVEVNPKLLAFTLGGAVEEVEAALEFLQRPDPESRSKEEDGRRIVKEGQFQYRVVNWGYYQGIKSEDERREYNRIKQAEYRGKKKDRALDGKQASNEARSRRYVNAHNDGDELACDRIAAEGAAGGGQ
jgi:hypothetical protein